jgi:ketosteroid isomerase-like protein
LPEALSDQVEWYEAESGPYWAGAAFVGRDAIVANVFARIPADFEDLHLHVRRIVGCGNTVLVEGRYSAISRATGQTLDAQVAHVWDFSDGKVTRWQQDTDTSQFARISATAPR